MPRYAPAIEELITQLAKLPGVGRKTAVRLAFHLLRTSQEDAHALARSIVRVRDRVRLCRNCFNIAESDLCNICSNSQRDDSILCVVEEPNDLMAIEGAGVFRGVYHVLHGAISPLEGFGPRDLRINELLDRLTRTQVAEVVIATNPTVEGEATCLYLARVIRPLGVKVTRIAQGIPAGADIEYVDAKTLGMSLEGRKEL